MLLPACTGTGLATFVMDRSAEAATRTLADALLFVELGSFADATVSVCVIVVPEAAVALTVTMNVKFAVALSASPLVVVQVSVPSEQVHPVGPTSDTAEVLAGRVSVNDTPVAAAGPAFVIVCV